MPERVSWSYSAVNTLRQCNRKYYFGNILASFGRKNALRRKAYELKKMQNLVMWKGTVVDKFMETTVIPAIIEKKELDFILFADEAVAMAEKQFDYSKFQIYTDPTITKTDAANEFCILDIHEIAKPYTEEELAYTYSLIRESILNIPTIKMPDGKPLIEFLKECNQLLPGFIYNTGFPFQIPGTAKPLHLSLKKGTVDFVKVMEDVFCQSMMAFSAPDRSNSLPITIKLIDTLLEPLAAAVEIIEEEEEFEEETIDN